MQKFSSAISVMISKIRMIIHSPFHHIQTKRLGKSIIQYSAGASMILDVGCGDMTITKYISNGLKNSRITGVDVLDYRRDKSLPFVKYHGTKIPFKDKGFDVTYTILTLHHCNNIEMMLKEMKRVTKKRIIVIEEYYSNHFDRTVTCVHDWIANKLESFDIPVPCNFHTDNDWKNIFQLSGFYVVHEERLQQFPFPFNFTKQMLYVLEFKK